MLAGLDDRLDTLVTDWTTPSATTLNFTLPLPSSSSLKPLIGADDRVSTSTRLLEELPPPRQNHALTVTDSVNSEASESRTST